MKLRSKTTYLAFSLFVFLVACGPSELAIQDGLADNKTSVGTNTSTPELTFTLEPTFTPTATQTQTPTITPTPTQAPISSLNIDRLSVVKRLGNKSSFSSFDSISLNQSAGLLAISGPVDNQVTSIIYDSSEFSSISTFPDLGNLVFSSDGSRVAGNNSGVIEFWDVSANEKLLVIEGSSNTIKELAWSSEAGEIAGVDTDNVLYIWDSNSGEEKFIQQLSEPTDYSDVKLEYSPTGIYLSIIGIDSTLRVWDRKTINNITGHSDIITHSSWSPDEQFLATSSQYEENAYVWRMSNFNMAFNFSNNRFWISNITWSPNGEKIATADAEGTIKLWNAYTGGLSQSFPYFTSPLFVAWSPDGSKIASLYNDSTVKVYDIGTKQEFTQPENIQNANYGFLWVDESILLFNYDSRMQLWNVQSGEIEMFINPTFGKPRLIALSPNGKLLAYVEHSGNVLIVDVESGEILFTVTTGIDQGIRDIAWSSNNKFLGIGSEWDEKVIVINAETGEIINTLEDKSLNGYVRLTWSMLNNQLITGAWEGKILIWDIESSEIIHVFEMYQSAVMDLEISQDGSRLTAIGSRGEIYVWNTKDWEKEFILEGPNDGLLIAGLSISPDGNKIAASGFIFKDNFLRETRYQIWDTNTQDLIKEWKYEGVAYDIAFSPDGLLLASSTCNIWDSSTGELLFEDDCSGFNTLWTSDNKNVLITTDLIDFWGVYPGN